MPDAGHSGDAFAGNIEAGEQRNQALFECAHVANHRKSKHSQIQQRIPHQLSRPVVGNIAAALDAEEVDSPPRELLLGKVEVRLVGAPSKRNHRLMLDEQKCGWALASRDVAMEGKLELPARLEAKPPQPAGVDRHRHSGIIIRASA